MLTSLGWERVGDVLSNFQDYGQWLKAGPDSNDAENGVAEISFVYGK